MRFMNNKGSQGFTLLELMLVLGIVGIISTFVISIASSVRNMSSVTETKSRMIEIAAKAKSYYRGHETLPVPTGTQVPIDSANLDLEQKYRLDSWGQNLYYNNNASITGLTVDNKSVAGVLISGGPNQTIETTTWSGGASTAYTTSSDDIVVPINVSKEATEIALEELRILQDKVNAFDALYEGFNNDGDASIDEDDCSEDNATELCPSNGTNDPNCGRATLDAIANTTAKTCDLVGGPVTYDAVDEVDDFIIALYSLSITNDPWANSYLWSTTNQKFYSGGPDGTATTADDIYP